MTTSPIADWVARPVLFDAGSSSEFLEGFYKTETDSDGRPFRWTGGSSFCKVQFEVEVAEPLTFRVVVGKSPRDILSEVAAFVNDAPIQIDITGEGPETGLIGTIQTSTNIVTLSFALRRTFFPRQLDPTSSDARNLCFRFYSLMLGSPVAGASKQIPSRAPQPTTQSDAHLYSLGRELAISRIKIRMHYQTLQMFDQLVKFEYVGSTNRILVVGSSEDSYCGAQIRKILRDECDIYAPLVDIELLSSVVLDQFDIILICYNKAQVHWTISSWRTADLPRVVYLDDIISKYHWLISICESLSKVFRISDIVRGLLGEPVTDTSSLQLDGWNSLRSHLENVKTRYANILIHGSGCGLLPVVLRHCVGSQLTVYESDPVYLSNLRLTQTLANFEVKPQEEFLPNLLDAKSRGDVRGTCIILCDSVNRIADPKDLAEILGPPSIPLFLTMFVSSETKPDQAAVFRRIGERNIAFNAQDQRDRRCYGSSQSIWLPREKSVRELVGTSKFITLYESNEYFASNREYASSYVVIEVGGDLEL
jgi:hypothetical protein